MNHIYFCSELLITAQNAIGPESYVIEIEKAKVPILMNEFGNEASLLADHLKILNNRMVLLNPRLYNRSKASQNQPPVDGNSDEEIEQEQPLDEHLNTDLRRSAASSAHENS